MNTVKKNTYFVGCLLAASKNSLNKIQFAVKENKNGKFSLYSRTSAFNRPFDFSKMHHVGDYPSLHKIASAINAAKHQMKQVGIYAPGVELYTVEDKAD